MINPIIQAFRRRGVPADEWLKGSVLSRAAYNVGATDEQIEQARMILTRLASSTGTIGVMPNKPKTPIRTMRVSDELWESAQAAAASQGESVSDVIRKALERYVKRYGPPVK